MTELGHGVGPFYKSSDESKALIWLRHCLLHEEGDTLHIAPGAPEVWFTSGLPFGVESMATFFGAVTYRITSSAQHTTLTLRRDPDHSRAGLLRTLTVHLRHPASAGVATVEVNGEPAPVPEDGRTFLVSSEPIEMQIDVTYR